MKRHVKMTDTHKSKSDERGKQHYGRTEFENR